MQNSMAVFTFFIFGWKRPFCANLVKNVKRVSLSLNLVASLIRICRVQWCCSLFRFRPEIPFLVKFGPNCQYCQLKVKRWNLIPRLIRICRIQWWCLLLLFRPDILFFGKFGPKSEDCQFKQKCGTQNSSITQNSMAMFTLFVLDRNTLLWQIWSKKSLLSV